MNLQDKKDLEKYLGKIDRIFGIQQFLRRKIDIEDIVTYYQESDYGYRIFHSAAGSIHMALNFDGVFDKRGYYAQARLIDEEYIKNAAGMQVLELASGNGFNSIFLANNNPKVDFVGIDLTPLHVETAKKRAEGISNLCFSQGNFQDLEFDDKTFDLVFEVESICHATDMKAALSEAYRVLKPGGQFVLFDGFRKPEFDSFSDEQKMAAKLVELAMAVDSPWKINRWLELAKEIGFSIVVVDDISRAIMPNLMRFQLLARGFFKYPPLSKTILKVLPDYLVQNAIAGLLMPFTISMGLQGYFKVGLIR